MTGLVKKLSIQHKVNILKEFRGKNDPLHDSTKYVSAADTPLGKNQAIEFMNRTGLDPAYRVFLENYRSFVKVLHEWVYETDDEFARLFLSRQFQAEPLTIEENVVQ